MGKISETTTYIGWFLRPNINRRPWFLCEWKQCHRSRFWVLAILLPLLLFDLSCLRKVPLTSSIGHFSLATFHWYETEGVAYLFFRLEDAPERLPESFYELQYSWKNASGDVENVVFSPINFAKGVHIHQVVQCGSSSTCGSYSWKVPGPLISARLVLRYSSKSDLGIDSFPSVSNHLVASADTEGLAQDQYSAIPSGIFNKENERLQIRVHHNFGRPTHETVDQFGMVRKFRFSNPRLFSLAPDEISSTIEDTGFFFSNFACKAELDKVEQGSEAAGESMIGEAADIWFESLFSRETSEAGACFTADFLDKNGETLVAGSGYGLRNPEINPDTTLVMETPLKSTTNINIVIKVCADDGFAGDLVYEPFLDYQKSLLGFSERNTDVCFNVSDPDGFAQSLRNHLVTRLSDAKIGSQDKSDFIFVVVFHEKLFSEFFHIHGIVAEELTRVAEGEKSNISPRLVGALVYGSTAEYQPTKVQKKYLLWCPQNLLTNLFDPDLSFAAPNCTTSSPADFTILGINVVAPLGPFPSLEVFKDYVEEFGYAGVPKEPDLDIYSVQINASARQEKNKQVTYFEGQTLTIGPGESVQVCFEKDDDGILPFLRFRPEWFTSNDAGFDALQASQLWLSDAAADEYQIGVVWEYAFWASLVYKTAVSGSFISVIPFQKSISSYDEVGERKWQLRNWKVGDLLMVCKQFCSHPVFDESQVYQLKKTWKNRSAATCTVASIPSWNGGGSVL